jgi:hypothetical protein
VLVVVITGSVVGFNRWVALSDARAAFSSDVFVYYRGVGLTATSKAAQVARQYIPEYRQGQYDERLRVMEGARREIFAKEENDPGQVMQNILVDLEYNNPTPKSIGQMNAIAKITAIRKIWWETSVFAGDVVFRDLSAKELIERKQEFAALKAKVTDFFKNE